MGRVWFEQEKKPRVVFNTLKTLKQYKDEEDNIVFEWDSEEDGVLIIHYVDVDGDWFFVNIKFGDMWAGKHLWCDSNWKKFNLEIPYAELHP